MTAPAAAPALLERVPPQNVEAEMALLGCLLVDGEMIDVVVPIVRPADFYRTAHRRLFEVCLAIQAHGEAVDALTVFAEAERRGCLEDVGGTEYLNTLVGSVAGAANAEEYARIVREKAVARDVIHVATELQRAAYAGEGRGDELLELVETRVAELANGAGPDTSVSTVGEAGDALVDRLLHRHEAPDTGVLTGLVDLDDLKGGLRPGELTIIAGRPSMGKSALALCIATNAAVVLRRPTVFVSLEMSKDSVMARVLGARASVQPKRIEAPRYLSAAEFDRVAAAQTEIQGAPLRIVDSTGGATISHITSIARRERSRHGLDLLVVDYLQLIEGSDLDMRRSANREQEVAAMSKRFKRLALQLGIPIVLLAQLNRLAEGRSDNRPRLADLRESGSIEQDADAVLLLFREDYYARGNPGADHSNRGVAELFLAKQRNGAVDTVRAHFEESFMRFENLARAFGHEGRS